MRYNPHQPTPPDAAPIRLDRPYKLEELPTPALVVDVDAMQRNITAMVEFLGQHGVQARPHTKTHKCPIIAHRQIAAGTVGICCAKVSEAEVMLHSGVEAILITSPVATEDKAQRVVDLARLSGGSVAVVVDSSVGARLLSEIARRDNLEVPVLIDLDPGMHRTGITPGEPAIELAREINELNGIGLWGLQAYAGQLMHIHGWDERRKKSLEFWEEASQTRRAIEQLGISLPIMTGGGTGTFDIDIEVGGITDLQVGSYLFMDREYRAIGGKGGAEVFDPFETSLFVLATAISKAVEPLITIDAGFKSFATDTVKPELLDIEGVKVHFAGDEHSILQLLEPSRPIALGDRLRLSTPHCDPTVNLYDHYFALEHDQVQELWPIAGRGKSQ